MADVFISHAEEDRDIAKKIAVCLEDAKYKTWYYERDFILGMPYLDRELQAIEDSKAFVLVISSSSLGSNQVTSEVVLAHEGRKPFFPILVDVSDAEFKNRQPEWRAAVGAATSVSLQDYSPEIVCDLLIKGLKARGILPQPQPPPPERKFEIDPRMPSAPLFGRESALTEALKRLEKHSLAITGIKGVGKSKVASALFERCVNASQGPYKTFYWRRFSEEHPPFFRRFWPTTY